MPPRAPKIVETQIVQSFLDEWHPPFPARVVPESRLTGSYLDWLLEEEDEARANRNELQTIGMHLMYTSHGHLAALAICCSRKVLIVTDIMKARSSQSSIRQMLQIRVLSAASGFRTVAFDAHKLVLALYRDMNLRCARAVDILSLPPRNRDIVQTVKRLAGENFRLFESEICEAFEVLVYDKKRTDPVLAQQAWFSWFVGSLPEAREALMGISVIDSTSFSQMELDVIAQNMEGLVIRELEKPAEETIDVSSSVFTFQGSKASWTQQAYGKRLQASRGQVIKAGIIGGVSLPAAVPSTQGQRASLHIQNLDRLVGPSVHTLTVSGRRQPTQAERKQAMTILHTLQGKSAILDDLWVQRLFPSLQGTTTEQAESTSTAEFSQQPTDDGWNISPGSWLSNDAVSDTLEIMNKNAHEWSTAGDGSWTPASDIVPPMACQDKIEPCAHPRSIGASGLVPDTSFSTKPQQLAFQGDLNASQTHAVLDMLDLDKHISVIQGPPGTGKTTVIAAYVAEVLATSDNACLVVAQSNVAIKNVGEKLHSSGIGDWVLVVSSEFLIGWHEHLYEHLSSSNMLSSKDIRHPLHARVVLCTLSMISSIRFTNATRHLHFASIIVEEASQIPMSSYLSMIAQYSGHLRKINFIGDDRQLPPYAPENTKVLESIFENKGLLSSLTSVMLDIQYRMPPTIGDFISKEVYLNQLASWDSHPVKSALCVQFLNIEGEEELDKFSFKSLQEASASISVAAILTQKQRSFKIITPYETQRDLLEQSLRASGLPWSNTCFTVDSFQGKQ